MRISLRRPLLGALALGLASSAVAAPAQSANRPSKDASSWLAGQLQDGLVVTESEWGTFTNYGASLDILFVLDELDLRAATRAEILDAIEPRVDEYISYEGTVYAGPAGKLLAAVQAAGIAPAEYGDGDLVETLTARVVTEGDQAGRATDGPGDDYSNTLGQGWVVRALAVAGDPLAGSAAEFLLEQQCDAGFFRESMGDASSADPATFACDTAEDEPSVDATALAVLSLRAAQRAGVPGLGDDIRDAVSWLRKVQRRNGSFVGNGVPNTNSTGLAASVLSTTRWKGAAGTAAAWLAKHQVTTRRAAGNALEGEVGAVAYDRPALVAGQQDGISGADAPQWILATAQSAVGLESLLPKARLVVKAPARAQRGEDVRVKVKGLAAGERWTLRLGKKKAAGGWANRRGVAVTEATMTKAGKVRLKAKGSRAVRSGVDVVRVR